MKLNATETAAVRALCLEAIEKAKAQGLVGKSYKIPLVIPFPGEPYERSVTLEVSAAPEDFE